MIFEAILNEAAQRAKEQEARTEALKEQRRQEVYGDLGTVEKYPKPKRINHRLGKPKKGERLLTPHKKFILDRRDRGVYLSQITRDLKNSFGITVCQNTLSKFIRECQENG